MRAPLLVIFAALAVIHTNPTTLFLDLTTPGVEKAGQPGKVFCGGVSGGVFVTGKPYRPPELAVRLEIARVNATRFAPGEGMVVDVQLTNIGSNNISLPWNPDEYVIYGENCRDFGRPLPFQTLVAGLGFKVKAPGGHAKFLGGTMLYARLDRPATYRDLAPGGSATIRVRTNFYPPMTGEIGRAARGPRRFAISAVLDLTDSRLRNPYRAVTSGNSVQVTEISK
jgi:hypothetical protein